ncbi:MAG: hypothetical protein HC769_14170 [Cyanobacteria bacterium CRU_2_1]|nr:hypothetical protein [Cyanobacteria bacterium CRU_2_1]
MCTHSSLLTYHATPTLCPSDSLPSEANCTSNEAEFIQNEPDSTISEAGFPTHEASFVNGEAGFTPNEASLLSSEASFTGHEASLTASEASFMNHEASFPTHEAGFMNHEASFPKSEASFPTIEASPPISAPPSHFIHQVIESRPRTVGFGMAIVTVGWAKPGVPILLIRLMRWARAIALCPSYEDYEDWFLFWRDDRHWYANDG